MWNVILAGAVILLGTVLTVLGLQYIHTSNANAKLNAAVGSVGQIIGQVDSLYDNNPNGYQNIALQALITAGAFPNSMVKGSTVVDAWGGDVTVQPSSSAAEFSLEYQGLPKSACERMATINSGSITSVSVNGTSMSIPVNPTTAATSCSASGQGPGSGNSVTFTAT